MAKSARFRLEPLLTPRSNISSSWVRLLLTLDHADHADRTTPYTLYRWGATAGLLLLFMIRILIGQAYYIVTVRRALARHDSLTRAVRARHLPTQSVDH